MLHRPLCFFTFIAALVSLPTSAAETPSIQISPQTKVRFAAVDEGQAAIAREDAFTATLSTFDLQCRLKTEAAVTAKDLMKLYADNVTAWPEEEVLAVAKALEFVTARIAKFVIPQPQEVLLIRTTGQEESGAAYCRGPAIVLPVNMLRQREQGLQRLLAHELFHVISSHNPSLRRDLYAIIGFRLCNNIALPQQLGERAITNPDAPLRDAYIELTLADQTVVHAVPLLVASSERYELASRKSLFRSMQFKMLVVESVGGEWKAAETDGQPRLLEPGGLDSYALQIGKNTGYIIHPDEILADNFAHLIMQTPDLPSPTIVSRMQLRLEQSTH